MFGLTKESPQNEKTPFRPRSPYGISKVAGFDLTRYYREGYGIFTCSGILFNHESPRRGFEFVTRKITTHAAKIKLGLENKLRLGSLKAKRDWGHSKDYVRAMWLMLQQDKPDDYVISTGEAHTVEEFAKLAFEYVELDYRDYIEIDSRLIRPTEVHTLCGDSSKAQKDLKWYPSISFQDLIKEMIESDLKYYSSSV